MAKLMKTNLIFFDETMKLTYNASDPIDDTFNSVEELYKIAELANCPYSAIQQVNIGYLIVFKNPFLEVMLEDG